MSEVHLWKCDSCGETWDQRRRNYPMIRMRSVKIVQHDHGPCVESCERDICLDCAGNPASMQKVVAQIIAELKEIENNVPTIP